MKQRPILFQADMVRALKAGTKTQTRRAVKPQPAGEWAVPGKTACPYGQPGDRLWVREAWRAHVSRDAMPPREIPSGACLLYEADDDRTQFPWAGKYRPPMFMPRWASRILLEVVSVRVERLQDISADDARAEGCPDKPVPGAEQASVDAFARQWYGDLWEKLNGPGSWAINPWVWAIEFKVLVP